MRREWAPEELIGSWTLLDDDWRLVGNKTSVTRLGFCVLLKFFELEARFPRHAGDVPPAAVGYVAAQVKVDPGLFGQYAWSGSTIEYHRAQIRTALGFREPTRADEERLIGWLAAEICPVELTDEGLKSSLWARCRAERIEPPGRTDRILGSARNRFEQQFCALIEGRLTAEAAARLEELIVGTDPAEAGSGRESFAELKADPGRLGLGTLLEEMTKLSRVRNIGLPVDLFAGHSERLVAAWRTRAATCYPSDLVACPRPVRLTLLAALCWSRTSEITDALVDLLIRLIMKINTRAEKKVEKAIYAELKRVHGKTDILFRLATAAVEHPDETVREVLYPVVGEKTLRDLVAEAKANEPVRHRLDRLGPRHRITHAALPARTPNRATVLLRAPARPGPPIRDDQPGHLPRDRARAPGV